MVKLNDVAKAAGVSPMTVSRYINKSGYVSEKNAAKIQSVIDELEYYPNRIAKSLVTKKSDTIGLVIASITNPFYPYLVLGVEDVAHENGSSTFLCNLEGKGHVLDFAKTLSEHCIDGIIFAHLNLTESDVNWITSHDMRCVLIDNEVNCSNAFQVLTDDYYGSTLAMEHLIGLGHERIGLIYGQLEQHPKFPVREFEETFQFSLWHSRTKAYYDAMAAHNLPIDNDAVVEGNGGPRLGFEGGYMGMKKILSLKHRPTAVFVENDLMCSGVYRALYEENVRIPEEMSIVGFDGLFTSEWLFPPLTTVEQPKYEIGRAAALFMFDKRAEPYNVHLKPRLLVRSSTAPPKL